MVTVGEGVRGGCGERGREREEEEEERKRKRSSR